MTNSINIMIHIKSSQTDVDGNVDRMEFYTEGKLYKKGSSTYIAYSESEISGMEGTTTTIKLTADLDGSDTITLIRFGSINSKMTFKEGVTTNNRYETQYGIFDISIKTNKLIADIAEGRKSVVRLEYQLYFEESNPYTNELILDFHFKAGEP